VPEEGRHEALWKNLDDAYFQRFDAGEIAWHTRTLWSRVSPEKPLVRARLSPIGEGLEVMVYAPDQPGLFARITGFFERMQFDVAAARIYTTQHGFALDSFQVLTRARSGEHYRDLIRIVEGGLATKLDPAVPLEPPPSGRISRWVKHFPVEPSVAIVPDRREGRWQVQLSCADRPGLLSAVARVLLKHELNLIDARVTTLGLRAEDTFVVSGDGLVEAAERERIAVELTQTAAS